MERSVEIFDSTLRDGAQGEGISFSVEDKLAIVQKLDELGVTFIEAGNPGSNPKDLEFFRRVNETQRKHAQLVAFGSTRRKGIKAEDDGNIRALLAADTPVVAVFGKCWDLHVTQILGTTLAENLSMIEDTCSYLAGRGKRVFFDAEHFFDGYKENPEFAMEALRAAQKGGAACLALCDTNGGCFPDEIARITKAVAEAFPELTVSIHTHNDGGGQLHHGCGGGRFPGAGHLFRLWGTVRQRQFVYGRGQFAAEKRHPVYPGGKPEAADRDGPGYRGDLQFDAEQNGTLRRQQRLCSQGGNAR